MTNLSCVIFLLSALSFSYHDPTSSLAGAWCSMFGAWCMVHGAARLVLGEWSTDPGAWCNYNYS